MPSGSWKINESETMKRIKSRVFIFFNILYLIFLSNMHFASSADAVEAVKQRCDNTEREVWTAYLSKKYAKFLMGKFGWNRSEFKALDKLWTAESNWRPMAFNKVKDRYSGKNAGGIPQLLGLDPDTPAPYQIERGLAYIQHRYEKPSIAWQHHRKHGWY